MVNRLSRMRLYASPKLLGTVFAHTRLHCESDKSNTELVQLLSNPITYLSGR